MFKSQSDVILKEKNSAFKVLIATQKKLEATCQKASDFIEKNYNEISKKKQEIVEKEDLNNVLGSQIDHMKLSIQETERIINPKGEQNGDGNGEITETSETQKAQ